jgi:hypothetical protein
MIKRITVTIVAIATITRAGKLSLSMKRRMASLVAIGRYSVKPIRAQHDLNV